MKKKRFLSFVMNYMSLYGSKIYNVRNLKYFSDSFKNK